MATAPSEIQALTDAIANLLKLQLQNEQSKSSTSSTTTIPSDLYNKLSSRIEKYSFSTGEDIKIFDKWLQRHEYTIISEAATLSPEMRNSSNPG